MCDSFSPKTSPQLLSSFGKLLLRPKGTLPCNLWVIEGNRPRRKKGFQHLNGIVLNERNGGVGKARHAASFSWLSISDFWGEMEQSLLSGSYCRAACLSSLPA